MSKEFDIIIWGATGFTGRLVAEYIFKNYSSEKLNWAIAGRDKKKLINVRDKIADKNIPIIIADSFDEVSLTKMTQRTKVICSTVGPYSKYGSLLVKSCIKTNTHYCDLAGEAQWIRKIIDTYHQEAKNKKISLQLALNYGSKDEIINSLKNIIKKKQKITTKNFEQNLYTSGLPDPDILIRTGGQRRISNFLLWQIAYTEIFFVKKMWPDFNKNDFQKILNKFKKIKRNFGKI